MKTFEFSLVLRTRENTDAFITLDDNIYGIHSKRVNILYLRDPYPLPKTNISSVCVEVVLLIHESLLRKIKSQIKSIIKQRRGLNRSNVLRHL